MKQVRLWSSLVGGIVSGFGVLLLFWLENGIFPTIMIGFGLGLVALAFILKRQN
jgi:hypothetical protein